MQYHIFDVILEGYEAYNGGEEIGLTPDEYALDFARGFVWSEYETRDSTIGYANYIDTINGVGIYYDYGADYYFFTNDAD